jgi:hypothetical protein
MAYKVARNINIGDASYAARKMAMINGSPVVSRNDIASKAALIVDDDGRPVSRRARRFLAKVERTEGKK